MPVRLIANQLIPSNTVATVAEALKSSADDFMAKFGRDKPASEQEIVFHCKLGGRAQKAADQAFALGFKKLVLMKIAFPNFYWLEFAF